MDFYITNGQFGRVKALTFPTIFEDANCLFNVIIWIMLIEFW